MVNVDTKQVIVIRKDLGMRRGKEIAQGAHAAMMFMTRRLCANSGLEPRRALCSLPLSRAETHWLVNGFRKITVVVQSEEELMDLWSRANALGVSSALRAGQWPHRVPRGGNRDRSGPRP